MKEKEYIHEYIDVLEADGLPIEKYFFLALLLKDIQVNGVTSMFASFHLDLARGSILTVFVDKRRRNDVLRGIEPVGFHPKDFIDEDPLVWEIKTTGIEVWPNNSKNLPSENVQ
jgi:hypothetical protein